ncbi:MAG: amidohydrolase [bacterium]|jgi:predicted amidohydrolase YtcJ
MTQHTIYQAKHIHTMNSATPAATHVAVREGRILAVGSEEEVRSWGDAPVDMRFADKVLLPGFVEGHAHLMAGGIWSYTYVGYHDRMDPQGQPWPALTDISGVLERLREIGSRLPPEAPLVAWGFDPIFLPSKRLDRTDLDSVSETRPIAVMHSNFHLMTVNSAALKLVGYSRDTDVQGVHKQADGHPSGELQEMAAMFPVMRRLGINFRELGSAAEGIRDYASVARRCGVTTATDLFSSLEEEEVERLLDLTGSADYSLRVVPALNALGGTPEEIAQKAQALRLKSTEMLRLGLVKVMTDGSIQGFTARVQWPHYYKGPNHGIWNLPPESLYALTEHLNREGIQMHLHVNGSEASKVTIAALREALRKTPFPDHRHTLQHCQMADQAQFRSMAALGLCANLFANHIYYFGDQHRDITIGPERAARMDACRTALDEGVPLAIHSDAPVTPMGPLFTAWCAVHRLTGSGKVLGPNERISVPEALKAITIGAAYTLHLDHEIGSIESGKRADFAVLEEDPFTVPSETLKDVPVWGVVSGGRVFPAAPE